jgi:hypothetical protein
LKWGDHFSCFAAQPVENSVSKRVASRALPAPQLCRGRFQTRVRASGASHVIQNLFDHRAIQRKRPYNAAWFLRTSARRAPWSAAQGAAFKGRRRSWNVLLRKHLQRQSGAKRRTPKRPAGANFTGPLWRDLGKNVRSRLCNCHRVFKMCGWPSICSHNRPTICQREHPIDTQIHHRLQSYN